MTIHRFAGSVHAPKNWTTCRWLSWLSSSASRMDVLVMSFFTATLRPLNTPRNTDPDAPLPIKSLI